MFKIVDNNMNAHLWQAPCFESANESFINHEEGSCHQSHQSKEEKSRQAYDEAFAKGYKDGVAQGSADVNNTGWFCAPAGNSGKALRRGNRKRQVDQPAVYLFRSCRRCGFGFL